MLLPALPALRAQARGFSFTPVIGYMWPTPIFEHTVDFPTAEGFPQTQSASAYACTQL
jgi:hypothetical protein